MTTTVIRKKIHQYVDEADSNILEVVHQMFELYRKSNASYLSEDQQIQAIKTAKLFKEGKMKTYSPKEISERINKKLKR